MKNLRYIFLTLLLPILVSCEDFIDIEPQDQISASSFFKTGGDIESYVIKYYASLPAHGSAAQPASEAASDNLILAVPNAVLDGNREPSVGNWRGEWSNIRSINILFDNLGNVTDEFALYKHFLGEAHFFKAWFYFNMLSTYGDVPWYTSELNIGDDELFKPRDSRTLVADSILLHLDKAIEYLDPRSKAGNTRLNKEAALAFKTRVALFEGTWQKYHAGTVFGTTGADPNKYFQAAVDAAEELISGTSYTKGIYNTGNPDIDYYEMFGLDDMSGLNEVLLYRIASSKDQLGHDLQFRIIERPNGMSVTWSLVTSYLGKDGNPYDYLGLASTTKGNAFLTQIAADCDPRLQSTIWIPGNLKVASTGETFNKPFIDQARENLNATGFQVKKFGNPYSEAASAGYGGNSETGRIIFRYGEVLLNYAEALYELEGTVATDALNLLRARVGMPDFAVIPQANYGSNLVDYGYPVSDALYAIRNERRVELALESFREDDYRRWAAHALFKGLHPLGYPYDATEFPDYTPPLDGNGLIDYYKNLLPNGYGFREDQDYLTSIPQDEITLNPNLKQNPNW